MNIANLLIKSDVFKTSPIKNQKYYIDFIDNISYIIQKISCILNHDTFPKSSTKNIYKKNKHSKPF